MSRLFKSLSISAEDEVDQRRDGARRAWNKKLRWELPSPVLERQVLRLAATQVSRTILRSLVWV